MAVFNVFAPLENIALRFKEDQVKEIIEWFGENSKPLLTINNGLPINVITIDQFNEFMALKKYHRRSFHYPSYAEIMNEAEKLKAGITRMLNMDQFLYILNKWVIEPEIKHELKLAFKVFDTEKRDILEIDEIQTIVTAYKDKFSDAEIQELLRDANVRGDGNVYYEEFVESLFKLAPELYDVKTEYLYENPDEDPSVPPETVVIVENENTSPSIPTPPPTNSAPAIKGKK